MGIYLVAPNELDSRKYPINGECLFIGICKHSQLIGYISKFYQLEKCPIKWKCLHIGICKHSHLIGYFSDGQKKILTYCHLIGHFWKYAQSRENACAYLISHVTSTYIMWNAVISRIFVVNHFESKRSYDVTEKYLTLWLMIF